jgi:hypothetical protein
MFTGERTAMTAQLAMLKAPSRSLLTGRLIDPEFWQNFFRDLQILGELQQLKSDVVKLARPLACAKDTASLEIALNEQLSPYIL